MSALKASSLALCLLPSYTIAIIYADIFVIKKSVIIIEQKASLPVLFVLAVLHPPVVLGLRRIRGIQRRRGALDPAILSIEHRRHSLSY